MKKIILLLMFMFVSVSTVELKASHIVENFCREGKLEEIDIKEHKTKEEIHRVKYCSDLNHKHFKIICCTLGIIVIIFLLSA